MPNIDTHITPNNAEQLILKSIRELAFGEVKVTLHNSQIVQLETTSKQRFVNEKVGS